MVATVELEKDFDAFFGKAPWSAFHPHAVYDKHLDCIRVFLRDCSATERRIDTIFTVLEDNYPDKQQQPFAGFTIKGVKHVFRRIGLPVKGVYALTVILDKIVKTIPEERTQDVKELIQQPLLTELGLEVKLA